MSPEEKKSCVRVFEEHEKEWTPACIETLHAAVGVQLKDMQHLRVCLDAAEADPSHLDMMAPSSFVPTTLTAEGEQAKTAMVDANRGLVNFQFVPKNRKGERLFATEDRKAVNYDTNANHQLNHCAKFVRRRAAPGSSHLPSTYLDVETSLFSGKRSSTPRPRTSVPW